MPNFTRAEVARRRRGPARHTPVFPADSVVPHHAPVASTPPFDSIAEAQADAVVRILAAKRSVEHVLEIAADASGRFTEVTESAERPRHEPACAKGCAFCCHLVNIAVTIPEVVAVATHLTRTATPDELNALRERMDAHLERTNGTSREQRYTIRHPCPLLVDESCSVYDVRPLACRGWNSLDASACEEDFHHPERDVEAPASLPPVEAARQIRGGLYLGLRRAGLQHDHVDLVRALKIALDRPEALREWLDGRPFLAPDD